MGWMGWCHTNRDGVNGVMLEKVKTIITSLEIIGMTDKHLGLKAYPL